MESNVPDRSLISDLTIPKLGEAKYPTALVLEDRCYVKDSHKVFVYAETEQVARYCDEQNQEFPKFEIAGPREKMYFDPKNVNCGIVTCGGLCPGLNDVIRTITLTALLQYRVKSVIGFYYGYHGMSKNPVKDPIELTPKDVRGIQHQGGSILGTSRGTPSVKERVDTLVKHDIKILFVIGGDGTLTGAHDLCEEIKSRGLDISIIGVPKTIDNDIVCSELTFGFGTSVEEAAKAISCADNEAKSAYNGVGLVKVMGRDSGFIAAFSSIACGEVNFCLIPEQPFELYGKDGFLEKLLKRVRRKSHAVIVVAEGAGQEHLQAKTAKKDKSGNLIHKDIGLFLKDEITKYFKKNEELLTLKYIDPSYTIRSCPANARDSVFCLMLGQMAVHAGMAGKTDMFVGYWNHHFTHVPFSIAINKRKKIDLTGSFWQALSKILE